MLLLESLSAIAAEPTTASIKVLYIAGWQRSGSTVLANILGQIDGFFSTGELFYLWDYVWSRNILCGCGRRFHDCAVWSAVVQTAFGGAANVDVRRMLESSLFAGRTRHLPWLMLPWSRKWMALRLRDYVANLGRLYAAIVAVTGARVIVDSSKWPSYARVLQTAGAVDLYVVHLVRDPRAVAHSWLRRKVLPDRDPPGEMYRSPVDSSLRWNAWNVATEVFWGRVPERYLLLRYEDFVAQPRAAVERVIEMVGEDSARLPFVGEHTVVLRPTHTVSGNPVRLESGRTELRPDDEWRNRMSRRDKARVAALTLPLLWRYGYLSAASATAAHERAVRTEGGVVAHSDTDDRAQEPDAAQLGEHLVHAEHPAVQPHQQH